MEANTKQKLLRLPGKLLDDVTKLADRNQRSAEAEIRVALQEHVDRHPARARRRRS